MKSTAKPPTLLALSPLLLLLVLAALTTHLRGRELQIICNTTAVKSEESYADSIFAQSVANAVAVGCSATNQWYGGKNDWGIEDKSHGNAKHHYRHMPPLFHRPKNGSKGNGGSKDVMGGSGWEGFFSPDDWKDMYKGRNLLRQKGDSARRPHWRNSIYRRMKASFKEWGITYARAIAFTQITCKSYDKNDPYQCTESKEEAVAVAKARADFVAEVTSMAFNDCKSCKLTAEAEATLSASLLLQLTAKASAKVDAKVCVGAGGTASAEGYMNCFGLAIARGFAKTIAKAMLAGNCFDGLQARAEVEAEVTADAAEICACTGWVSVQSTGDGFAQADAEGSCDAFVEQPPAPKKNA